MPQPVFSAVLFGSRARGDNTPESDYDVLLVGRDRAELELALDTADRSAGDLRAALGVSVSVLGYTLSEVVELANVSDNFIRGVMRDGIVLAGVPPQGWGSHRPQQQ